MRRTRDPAARTLGSLLRRRRWWLIVGTAFLVAVAVGVLTRGARSADDLDPRNPGPTGAQAIAEVLSAEGVEVDVVRSVQAVEEAAPGAGETVVVTGTANLGSRPLARLRTAASQSRLILVQPPETVTEPLGLEPGHRTLASDDHPARCNDAELDALLGDLRISHQEGVEYPATSGCFFGSSGALLRTDRTGRDETGLVILGAADVLANARVLEADNAAVGLRLLGQSDRLIWYVPNPAERLDTEETTVSELLPDWLRPALWLLGLGMVASLLVHGRRLGPLAVEPLPVTVRAIETTRSRGRLYHRAQDRGHAAAHLRAATRRGLRRRLRLDPGADDDSLLRDVARHTGRDLATITALLAAHAPTPASDDDLISLAGDLAALEKEVGT